MRVLSAVVFAALLACNPPVQPPAPPPVPGAWTPAGAPVVKAGGLVVDQTMVDAVASRIPPEQLERMKSSGQYNQFLKRIGTGQLLYAKALEAGIADNPDTNLVIAMAVREVLAGEYIKQVSAKAVTDQAVREFYNGRKVQYARPAVHALHILVKEQDKANDLVRKLRAGADFAKLASQHSLDTGSAAKGGDLGWFQKGQMIPEVSEAAFGADVGAITDPIETRYGFHILKVIDKRQETPLEDVRAEIETAIEQQAVEKLMGELQGDVEVIEAAAGEVTPPAGAKAKGGKSKGGKVAKAKGGKAGKAKGGKSAPAKGGKGKKGKGKK